MGQINLYKIDENKKDDFLNKLTENLSSLENKIITQWKMKKLFIL